MAPRAKAAAVKAMSKAQIVSAIAEDTGLTRKDVSAVFESLSKVIKNSLGRSGPGAFNMFGLLKITKVSRPATKARPGTNPFTGEEIMIKAKPARKVVKVTALKGLKEMV